MKYLILYWKGVYTAYSSYGGRSLFFLLIFSDGVIFGVLVLEDDPFFDLAELGVDVASAGVEGGGFGAVAVVAGDEDADGIELLEEFGDGIVNELAVGFRDDVAHNWKTMVSPSLTGPGILRTILTVGSLARTARM